MLMSKTHGGELAERIMAFFWFGISANVISRASETPFWIVFPLLLFAVAALGLLALAWMVRRAKQINSRPGQFGIAALLLVMFYLAVLFGFVQWLVVRMRAHNAVATTDQSAYLKVLPICAVFVVLSLPAALWLVEATLWTAVRLTRWLIHTNISDSDDHQFPTV